MHLLQRDQTGDLQRSFPTNTSILHALKEGDIAAEEGIFCSKLVVQKYSPLEVPSSSLLLQSEYAPP